MAVRLREESPAELSPAQPSPLGAVLRELLDASETDFAAATSALPSASPPQQPPLRRALASLSDFVCCEARACSQLLPPLLDHCARKRPGGRSHARVSALLHWLLCQPALHRATAAALEALLLSPSPHNRTKLTAAGVLDGLFARRAPRLRSCGAQWAQQSVECVVRGLAECALREAGEEGGRRGAAAARPTVLALAAAGGAVRAFGELCECAAEEWRHPPLIPAPSSSSSPPLLSPSSSSSSSPPLLSPSSSSSSSPSPAAAAAAAAAGCADALRRLLACVRGWRAEQPLFVTACGELAARLSEGEMGPAAALLWARCAPLLLPQPAEARAADVEVALHCWLAVQRMPEDDAATPATASTATTPTAAAATTPTIPAAAAAATTPTTAAAATAGLHSGRGAGAGANARGDRMLRERLGLTEESWRLAGGEDGEWRARMAHCALCCIALQLAALPPEARRRAIQAVREDLYVVAAEGCATSAGAALPLALLQAVLPALLANGAQAASLLQPLLDMLQATDEASSAAIALTSQLILAYPALLLPDVCAKLDSPLAVQRANALSILSALCERCELTPSAGPAVAQQMACALLPRLADEHLFLRLDAARLFAQVDAPFIVPKLVPLLAAEPALRSAAESAALASLAGPPRATPRDAGAAAALLFDVIRDLPHLSQRTAAPADAPAAPSHPGQIGPSAGAAALCDEPADDKAVGKLEERVLRLVRKWAERVEADRWPRLLHVACTKFFAAAHDASSLRVLKQLLSVEQCLPHLHHLADAALQRLRAVPELKEEAEESATFDRLRPLLLLNLLPEKAWLLAMEAAAHAGSCDGVAADAGDACSPQLAGREEECRELLLARLEDPRELQPVRKMAASLLARLPVHRLLPQMAALVKQLAAKQEEISTDDSSHSRASLALYYVCCAVSLHPDAAREVASAQYTDAVFPVFSVVGAHEKFRRLQLGCMDCFARALCVQILREVSTSADTAGTAAADSTTPRKPFIEELPPPHPACGEREDASPKAQPEKLLPRLLMLLRAGPSTPCGLNILIMASQQLAHQGGARAAATLASLVVPELATLEGAETLQALFSLAFHSQSLMAPACAYILMQRALTDARSSAEKVRVAALKLLGASLTCATTLEAWGPNPDEMVRQVMNQLAGIETIDASPAVRQLAAQLMQTAFTPPTLN